MESDLELSGCVGGSEYRDGHAEDFKCRAGGGEDCVFCTSVAAVLRDGGAVGGGVEGGVASSDARIFRLRRLLWLSPAVCLPRGSTAALLELWDCDGGFAFAGLRVSAGGGRRDFVEGRAASSDCLSDFVQLLVLLRWSDGNRFGGGIGGDAGAFDDPHGEGRLVNSDSSSECPRCLNGFKLRSNRIPCG